MVLGIASAQTMNQNSIFRSTRWRLTVFYTSVISILFLLCGFGVWRAIVHAHRVTLERELESVAGNLHDNLESTLKRSGKLESASLRYLPNLYVYQNSNWVLAGHFEPHTLNPIYRGGYYVRLLDAEGQPIAQAGIEPNSLPLKKSQAEWQLVEDSQGDRYQQISLPLSLHDVDGDNVLWGYMEMGRSWQEFDNYLASLRRTILSTAPIILLLVIGVSWYLAGLAMKPLYLSYRQIQQFTTDAAHELRTPLAAVRATLESLTRMHNFSEAEAREILKIIERQNLRLSELVSDLLFLSRLDRQMIIGDRHLLALQDIIADIEEELAALALQKEVSLISEVQSRTLIEVMGNEEQLYRAIFNLVANAINYTPAGGQIIIALSQSDRKAIIEVKDTGIGIAPEHQSKIFDRFYRVMGDRSRHSGGSGLGLAIAKAIAKAHQGDIKVQSELNKGSIFTIQLPTSSRSN